MSSHQLKFIRRASVAGITIGRSNTASVTGTGSSYSIGWSTGGAAASGSWLVLVARDNISNNWNITGGAAWTQIGSSKIWYKQCGGSEPASYSLSYSGSNKDEAASMTILEVLGASSMESAASAANTNTPPSVTSTNANDLIVIAGGYGGFATTGVITPPSGYTVQSKRDGQTVITAIATKPAAGSGTISPGAWSITNSLVFQQVATLAFKP
jgi:hypothetical protein